MSFSEDIDRALALLSSRGRASVRAIGLELGADADYAKSIRDEIVDVLRLAVDDGNGILTVQPRHGSPPVLLRPKADRAAERRLVTFVFCDVVSSTPLSMRLDPEDLRSLMLSYQNACATAVERFEGHISQWLGDGAVIYFGFPEAHDDDAVRAIHAARAMIEAVAELPAAGDGSKLQVRVGVHTGWAVVGNQGKGKSETAAFGEAPNICARIETCAMPNTVAVSEATHALTEGYFEFADLGGFDLKGVDRTMRLYRVGAPTGAGVRFDVVRDQGLLPLVNRHRERRFLSAGWRDCQAGEGLALLIEGEPGIGKSRIVHFAKQLAQQDGRILEIGGLPYQRQSASRAVSLALAGFLGLDRLPAKDRFAALAQQVDDPHALPVLAEFLDVKQPDGVAANRLEPGQMRSATFEVVCAFVRKLAATTPLLVVVEDMHWLDPSSEELVRMLLQRLDDSAMFVLMTSRPEYRLTVDSIAGVVPHVITALTPDESIELAHLAMARDPDVNALAERIATRSGGNPLFIEELTRAVPLLGAGPGGNQAEIPYTLQSTLRARLDSVGLGARDIAEWAAVIGGAFDATLVMVASGLDAASVSAGLDSLMQAQLLQQLPGPAGTLYKFRHVLLQEASATGMLRSIARARHLAVANALLTTRPEMVRTEPEVIARHFAEAAEWGQELHYRTLAAEHSVSLAAYQEASAEIDRCLVLIADLPPGEERDRAELRVRLVQGGVCLATRGQGSAEAKAAFDAALALTQLLPGSPDTARALFGLWTFYFFGGNAATAVGLANEMLTLAEAVGAPEPRMMAHFACSASHQMMGDLAACLTHADKVQTLYDPAESEGYIVRYAQDPRVTAMTNACLALILQGHVDQARTASDQTVAHARRLGHGFVLSIALQIPAFLAVHDGDTAAAMAAALEWMAVAEGQGNPVYPALAAAVISWARAKAGDRDGLAQLRGIREGFLAQGVALVDSLFVTMLADAALGLGEVAMGLDILASFDGAARGALTYQSEHKRLGAALRLAGGATVSEVRPLLAQAREMAMAQGASLFTLRSTLDLAVLTDPGGGNEDTRKLVIQARQAVLGDCMDTRRADDWLG